MPAKTNLRPQAVLFDLDGTLADSAPDLIAALNAMRVARKLEPLDREVFTADQIANGSRSLMRAHLLAEEDDVEAHRPEFLAAYDATLHSQTKLFPGIATVLDKLDELHVPWAIITNKPTAQTQDLLPILGLDKRVAMVVCGDTYPQAKPDPTGVHAICSKLNINPQDGLLIGDALIDKNAAANAGMPFAAAGWGYWKDDADWVMTAPSEILQLLA